MIKKNRKCEDEKCKCIKYIRKFHNNGSVLAEAVDIHIYIVTKNANERKAVNSACMQSTLNNLFYKKK